MKKILVVNINWLGDAIFSTPVFKALKKEYPLAKIVCLCVPRVRDVLIYCPYIDEIIVFDEKGRHHSPWAKMQLILNLRKEKFESAFLLHRSLARTLMVWLAGIPLRIGYSKIKSLLTHPVVLRDESLHRSEVYLKVVKAFGIKIEDRLCELQLKIEDMQALDRQLGVAGILDAEDFIVINAGGNWDLKRWPVDRFVELSRRIKNDFGYKIVFSGGAQDFDLCQQITKDTDIPSVILAGKTSLGRSLALFKRAKVVISSDSGPLHLAHSVGADVIGIYGPTRPEITGPRGVGRAQVLFHEIGCNKAPCYHLACTNNLCMKVVSVDDVCQAIKKFLS